MEMGKYKPLVLMIGKNRKVFAFNENLLAEGFDLVNVITFSEAKQCIGIRMPDIILLNISPPDGYGLNFLPELTTLCESPILLCSGSDQDKDILYGLSAGAYDYISKPYNNEVVTARIKNIYHRELQVDKKINEIEMVKTPDLFVDCGPLRLDITANKAYLNQKDLLLSVKEFAVLHVLVQNEGKVISSKELYEKAWGCSVDNPPRLWKFIAPLRKKLAGWDGSPFYLTTIYGNGYRFYYRK